MTNVIEPTVLANLWKAHSDRLLLICRAVGEPAEDAVQEAFIALSTQTTIPSDPFAWLVRTARNALLQIRRGAGRRSNRERIVGESKDWFCTDHDSIEAQIDGRTAMSWLESLSEDQREIVAMHLWGGMSFRQIAEAIETPPSTANRIYHQALEELRNRAAVGSNEGLT